MFDAKYAEDVKSYFEKTSTKNSIEKQLDTLEAIISQMDEQDTNLNELIKEHEKLLQIWETSFQEWEQAVEAVESTETRWAQTVTC